VAHGARIRGPGLTRARAQADAPIKFVSRMRVTIGQTGVLMAKSRRGSLKLRFDHLGLPAERRDFWYPAEALTFP